jgi:hypothetical protein
MQVVPLKHRSLEDVQSALHKGNRSQTIAGFSQKCAAKSTVKRERTAGFFTLHVSRFTPHFALVIPLAGATFCGLL